MRSGLGFATSGRRLRYPASSFPPEMTPGGPCRPSNNRDSCRCGAAWVRISTLRAATPPPPIPSNRAPCRSHRQQQAHAEQERVRPSFIVNLNSNFGGARSHLRVCPLRRLAALPFFQRHGGNLGGRHPSRRQRSVNRRGDDGLLTRAQGGALKFNRAEERRGSDPRPHFCEHLRRHGSRKYSRGNRPGPAGTGAFGVVGIPPRLGEEQGRENRLARRVFKLTGDVGVAADRLGEVGNRVDAETKDRPRAAAAWW